jgi:hypothetical protein
MIPNDIEQMIAQVFPENEKELVLGIIDNYIRHDWSVYYQAARSLIYMSGGDLKELNAQIKPHLDSRDQIMEGERKAGNLGHYFGEGFDKLI